MKLFRAQRNCYTAGFALFLCFVIQRLMVLISSQAQLMAETKASLRQAKSASDAFEMRHSTSSLNEEITAPNPSNDELVTILEVHEQDVRTLRNELTESKGELIKLGIDCDTVKKQTAILSKEYDGLMIQHEKLKNEVAAVADSKNVR
ncbi:B-cell receptor-associated protein 29 [Halotydeus destructor]|nr:B-cell receptor-associated protein 29 [Halotydeus destructor]